MEYKEYLMEEALETIIDYRGKTPKKSETGIPTLSAKSVKNNHINYSECYYISEAEYKRFMVRGYPQVGDILLTTEAPMGMVARLDRDDVAIAQRLLTLRGKPGILSNDYLLYLLQSPYGQGLLKSKETGTTVTGIRQAEFRRIIIKLPDINIQNKITGILNSIDRKISCNAKINYNLLHVSLLQYRNLSSSAPQNGVIGDIIAEAPKSKIKVGDAKGVAGNYPFFTSGQAILEYDTPLVEGRNIYLNTGGNADVKFYIGPAAYSTDTWCVHAQSELTDYLYLALLDMKDEIGQTCFDGSTLKHLQKQKLKDKPLYIPSTEDKETLAAITANLDLISHNQRENKYLACLRDALLPKLISGALDVSNVEV